MDQPKQIVISGYYGFGNLGDEAILEALIYSLRDRFSDTDLNITVLSNSPPTTEEDHDVPAVNRWNPYRVLRLLKKTDLLISGGGGLLQDVTSRRSLWYYLGIIALAKMFRLPVYIVGQGIGPLKRKGNKLATQFICRRVDGFMIRDNQSFQILKEMNVNTARITEGLDLALLYPPQRWSKSHLFSDEDHNMVAAALKDVKDFRPELVTTVSKGLDKLAEEFGVRIALFSTHSREDKTLLQNVQSEMDHSANLVDTSHLTVNRLIEMIEELDMLIGGRLHALEFALLTGTPLLGISYDPKMDNLVEEINSSGSSSGIKLWQLDQMENDREFVHDVVDCYQNRENIRGFLNQPLPKLRTKAQQGLKVAFDWIEQDLFHEPVKE